MSKSDALSLSLKKVKVDLGNSQAEVHRLDELYGQSKTYCNDLEKAQMLHGVDLMRAKFFCALRDIFKEQNVVMILEITSL